MGKMWTKTLVSFGRPFDLMKMVLKLIAGVFPFAVLLTIENTKTKDPKVLSTHGS